MKRHHSDFLIIGAGMAGLACATLLAEAGRDVRVLDKGRGPGGRMAARRAEIAGETVGFDHGAQFFTARDAGFQAEVARWQMDGVVAAWPAAGHQAWVGTPGMNAPIRAMADRLDVHWATRALDLSRQDHLWAAQTGEETFTAKTVLVAVPAEQASELLEAAAPKLAAIAAAVRSEPCWAVMAGFADPLNLASDTLSAPDAAPNTPIAWAARNSAKPGRTGAENWVIHASPARSREIIDLPKEEAANVLLSEFFVQAGLDPVKTVHLVAHRWLYAMPSAIAGEPARFESDARIGIAGDYLHSPRVEGAWLSGHALAQKVLIAEESS